MSPEPDKQIAEIIAAKENVAPKMDETAVISDSTIQSTSSTAITSNILQTSSASSVNSNRPSRERRQQSPSSLLIPATTLFDAIAEAPVSPSSTSSADATFEPTIDMMVNDFDDEQTLNEEEALADQEAHNPDDEIATLREESEMPIEELLAKYGALEQAAEQPPRKKAKKCKRSKKRADKEDRVADAKMAAVTSPENAQEQCNETTTAEGDNAKSESVGDSVSSPKPGAIEAADEEEEEDELEDEDDDMHGLESNIEQPPILAESSAAQEILKTPQRRSHLLDLYPEGTFDGIVPVVHGQAEIFDDLNGDDIEDAEEEEDAETDPDSFKKSVMVGPEYQAFIPEGLSQYGDMLPYENEDKLIWEPSQVSEREVEEYLLKVRDIKPSMLDEENPANDPNTPITTTIVEPNPTVDEQPEQEKIVKPIEDKVPNGAGTETNVSEQNPVVKDNEQALHLLVQCGYDFKEALRRKRLNVLPLTSTMSLWSEDECSKFEEGIQKFGKDFLKIRQQLVRTRSMRELVQFYYLWKKSDRRDQNFANSDTVDHMDIYLNESTEYGPGNVVSGASGSTITVNASSHRKNSAGNHKNVSIMTKNAAATQANATAAATLATSHESSSTKLTHNRRRISLQENSTKIESSSEQKVSEIK